MPQPRSATRGPFGHACASTSARKVPSANSCPTADHALHLAGRPDEAKAALLATLDQPLNQEETQYLLNALTSVNALETIPDAWVRKVRANKKANEYIKRIADRLHQERR